MRRRLSRPQKTQRGERRDIEERDRELREHAIILDDDDEEEAETQLAAGAAEEGQPERKRARVGEGGPACLPAGMEAALAEASVETLRAVIELAQAQLARRAQG